jgi:formamidopyrimidine-DNA glycosylase
MGIEPLGNEMSGETIAARFKGRSAPLKAMLLDQKRIAGIGNIYACEAMWRAKLSPTRPAGSLAGATKPARARAEALADAIREVLKDAIAAGGSSLRDHRQATGELGMFQHSFAVYDREGEPCLRPHCKGVIRRMVQSGRSTFYCPVCQR